MQHGLPRSLDGSKSHSVGGRSTTEWVCWLSKVFASLFACSGELDDNNRVAASVW